MRYQTCVTSLVQNGCCLFKNNSNSTWLPSWSLKWTADEFSNNHRLELTLRVIWPELPFKRSFEPWIMLTWDHQVKPYDVLLWHRWSIVKIIFISLNFICIILKSLTWKHITFTMSSFLNDVNYFRFASLSWSRLFGDWLDFDLVLMLILIRSTHIHQSEILKLCF